MDYKIKRSVLQDRKLSAGLSPRLIVMPMGYLAQFRGLHRVRRVQWR